MATITGSITMFNQFSQVLNRTETVMKRIIGTNNQLQNQLGGPIVLDVEVAEATSRLEQFEQQFQHMTFQVDTEVKEDKKDKKNSSLLDSLNKIAGKVLTVGNLQKAISFVKWSDEIAQVNAQLNRVNDGSQTNGVWQQKVMAAANATRQSYSETARTVVQLGASTQGVFKNNQQLLDFVSRFNKMLTASGVSAEDSSSAIEQMTKSMSGGSLQSEDLQSLTQIAPMFSKVLANGLGVSSSALEKLAEKGQLTSAKIAQAFANQSGYIDSVFAKMPVTFNQAMTQAKNKAAEWISALNGVDGPMQAVTQAVMNLIGWLDTAQGQDVLNGLAVGIRIVADAFSAGVGLLLDHMDIVRNVLLAAGVVVLALAAYWLIMWAAALWPVFAVVGVIALLIAMLNHFGVSTQEIVGFVAGFFNALFAFLYNKVAFIWNILLSFAEFFVNLFIDPVYAVKKLFYDLAMTFMGHLYNMLRSGESFAGGFMKVVLEGINFILEGINKMIDALNNLPWFNIKPIKLLDTDNIHAVSDQLKKVMDGMEAPTSDKNVVDLSKYRMKEKDANEAFNAGKQYGNKVFDNASNALDSFKGKGDLWGAGTGQNNIDRVGEVGKIDSQVDISSEDLKAMRELAEMNNIQNFVTLQPQLTFGDTHVKSDGQSVDEIIANISQRLHEEIASSAQGVYG